MKKPIVVTHRQVRYIVGWRDKHNGIMHQIFVTDSIGYATKWCLKFNTLVVKYKKFLEQFEMNYRYGILEKNLERDITLKYVVSGGMLPTIYKRGGSITKVFPTPHYFYFEFC